MDRNWKSLPKNMSTDKHLQMLDVIADLDQLEIAENWFESLLCALNDILTQSASNHLSYV